MISIDLLPGILHSTLVRDSPSQGNLSSISILGAAKGSKNITLIGIWDRPC